MKQDFSAASDEQLLLNMRDRNDTRLGLSSPFFENSLSRGAHAFCMDRSFVFADSEVGEGAG